MRLRRRLDWRVLVALLVVGALALVGGVSIVSANEQNDQFCGSCHTQPETTYLARFQTALTGEANDLAAFHHKQLYPRNSPTAQHIKCIDCHVGEGLVGRGIVVSLAAWDALKYVTHTARQPAQVVFNIQNEGCIKCHDAQVKVNLDKPAKPFLIDNHFHYLLFEPGAPYESCVSCHLAHRVGAEANGFEFTSVYIPVCEDCHQKEGKGPVKM
jgi:hypothetical protein